MKQIAFSLLSCALLILFSCDKGGNGGGNNGGGGGGSSDTIAIAGKNLQQIVMMQKWRFTQMLDSSLLDGSEKDNRLACEKDDTYNFSSTSSGTYDEGTSKCSGNGQTVNFSWAMNKGATDPEITFQSVNWRICYQSGTKMIFRRYYYEQTTGKAYEIRCIFVK